MRGFYVGGKKPRDWNPLHAWSLWRGRRRKQQSGRSAEAGEPRG